MNPVVETGLLVATVLCVVANAFEVTAKLFKARFVLENSAEVGLAPRWIPHLALLEGAGVVGLVIGLLGVRPLGLAAAAGLVAFFVGAVAVHIRARVLHNIAFPGLFLALAVAALAHFAWAPA
ncbi:DoxX family protein [Saccharomonospora piscinae]|uniref:DoxX family protein n=1 Tax=Saccharomonospora piscinae TaxID=687388 RepID=UPI0011071212|nr:DoxX family protein [Saccharomonospora piscinae]TLW92299.1 DoxX family protein [Saccharomonospora piscinae]